MSMVFMMLANMTIAYVVIIWFTDPGKNTWLFFRSIHDAATQKLHILLVLSDYTTVTEIDMTHEKLPCKIIPDLLALQKQLQKNTVYFQIDHIRVPKSLLLQSSWEEKHHLSNNWLHAVPKARVWYSWFTMIHDHDHSTGYDHLIYWPSERCMAVLSFFHPIRM